MNKTLATLIALSFAAPAFAEGDAEAGEKTFNQCKSCHYITAADGTEIVKGGKVGPNLYGVIGRGSASTDFGYSKDAVALGETGLIWTEELLAEYVADPTAFLRAKLDDSKAKSKMVFKLRKGGEDVAAYLASVGPQS